MSARLLTIRTWEELAREANFQPNLMAAMCPISLRQLQRHFTKRFSKTPGEWARELRCRLARQLIAEGMSNRAVVMELGYGNESQLCHQFKRVFGVSPQNFAPMYRARPSIALGQARRFSASLTLSGK